LSIWLLQAVLVEVLVPITVHLGAVVLGVTGLQSQGNLLVVVELLNLLFLWGQERTRSRLAVGEQLLLMEAIQYLVQLLLLVVVKALLVQTVQVLVVLAVAVVLPHLVLHQMVVLEQQMKVTLEEMVS